MSKLIECDELGNWGVRGLSWFSFTPGNIITDDIYEKIYGCLWKLMEYESTGFTPEDIEKMQ